MEAGPVVTDGMGVFRDLAAQYLGGRLIDVFDSVEIAGADAAAAALALVRVDPGLTVLAVGDGAAAAGPGAALTAPAQLRVDHGRALVVLVHLPGPAAAAHADVLQRAAEARLLVALEMGQRDQDVGVHQRLAHQRGLAVLAVRHGHLHLVRAPQAVRDNDLTAGGDGIEAVDLRAFQMLHGVAPAARIERVAVRQKGNAAQLAHHIGHGVNVVGAQIGTVAQLAKVHLDGGELSLKVDVPNARRAYQLLKLRALADSDLRPEIRKVNRRLIHKAYLPYITCRNHHSEAVSFSFFRPASS